MKVYFPERIARAHVGGNTTYTRRLIDGLHASGIDTGLIWRGFHPAITAVAESAFGLKAKTNSVYHYTADTGPILRTRTPSVVTVHGIASHHIKSVRSRNADAVWRLRVRRSISSCERIITVSSTSARDLVEVFNIHEEKLTVIPHGIDADIFSRPTLLSEELVRYQDTPFVLYLGNIEPRKNLIALLEGYSASRLPKEGIELLVAGRPAWDYEPILRVLRSTKGATHIGFVTDNDRVALMQRTLLFAFPSLYEGFGFPVLEALAAGAVVATTRAGSLKDIAGPSIDIRGTDPVSIRDALETGVFDREARNTVLQTGRRWASQFQWSDSIAHHIALYSELVQR